MSREIKFRAWDKELRKMYLIYELKADLTEDLNKQSDANIILMQYTGLKDKNGTEIYEGDIIHLELDDENGVVTFVGGGFWVKWPRFEKHTFTTALWELNGKNEVIGNVHENPELLK